MILPGFTTTVNGEEKHAEIRVTDGMSMGSRYYYPQVYIDHYHYTVEALGHGGYSSMNNAMTDCLRALEEGFVWTYERGFRPVSKQELYCSYTCTECGEKWVDWFTYGEKQLSSSCTVCEEYKQPDTVEII